MIGTETVTVTPYDGTWVDGVFVPPAGSTFTVVASVQPVGAKMLERLPEASRTTARFLMLVEAPQTTWPKTTDLTASPRTPADRVTRSNGKTYEIGAEYDHTEHAYGLPHKAYTLHEVGADE